MSHVGEWPVKMSSHSHISNSLALALFNLRPLLKLSVSARPLNEQCYTTCFDGTWLQYGKKQSLLVSLSGQSTHTDKQPQTQGSRTSHTPQVRNSGKGNARTYMSALATILLIEGYKSCSWCVINRLHCKSASVYASVYSSQKIFYNIWWANPVVVEGSLQTASKAVSTLKWPPKRWENCYITDLPRNKSSK